MKSMKVKTESDTRCQATVNVLASMNPLQLLPCLAANKAASHGSDEAAACTCQIRRVRNLKSLL